ncbi:MAG: BON domain-containing protein [Pseudomonadota bacterium]
MISDAQLKESVLDELNWDTSLDAAHIGVTVKDGSVTLSGHVPSYPEKYSAIDAVKAVRGVKAIADEIEVHLPSEFRMDDSDIAERVAHVLSWSVAVPDDGVKAKVRNGFVTLDGEAKLDAQRRQIIQQIRHVRGVKGVSSLITLKPRASAPDVKKRIEDALKRNASLDASGIRVLIDGSKVTLEGDVKAYFERDVAERAAWTAPGVRQVVDHLHVE